MGPLWRAGSDAMHCVIFISALPYLTYVGHEWNNKKPRPYAVICVGTRRNTTRGATLVTVCDANALTVRSLHYRPYWRSGRYLTYLSCARASTFFRQPLGSAFARCVSPGLALYPRSLTRRRHLLIFRIAGRSSFSCARKRVT